MDVLGFSEELDITFDLCLHSMCFVMSNGVYLLHGIVVSNQLNLPSDSTLEFGSQLSERQVPLKSKESGKITDRFVFGHLRSDVLQILRFLDAFS